ncbi:cupin domain-containing protein [uncultured Amnibacterium sp.]|uniref:cupin domain-containing protein n=1 Tax=uncultured Amnibacterium sp. TaxID=1631851 RepID=UPI0035CC5D4D
MTDLRAATEPHRGQPEPFRWEGVAELAYKEHDSTFRGVTRRVLFGAGDGLGVEVRYFEVAPGGWSTLEHHEHPHQVIVLRGSGACLVQDRVIPLAQHDLVLVPGWAWHQFRATGDEPLGFQCVVPLDRDRPVLPSPDDLAALTADPGVAAFIRR